MLRPFMVGVVLVGCSSPSPSPTLAGEQVDRSAPEAESTSPERRSPERFGPERFGPERLGPEARSPETSATPEGSTAEVPPATGPLSVRLVLDRDTIPAGASSANNEDARVEGQLLVRNGGREPVTLTYTRPAAFELTWTLTDASGTVFEPVFLSPAIPRPGGRPPSMLTLAPNQEEPMANLHGISGFYEQGQAPDTWGPLPAGTYQVSVSGIGLGEARLTAPDVRLTVR